MAPGRLAGRGGERFIRGMKIFLTLLLALSTTLSAHADSAKWEKEISAFEAGDARQQPEGGGLCLWGVPASGCGSRW